MSTKCTIYYQAAKGVEDHDLHVYWDMGGHQEPGFYVDTGCAVVKIENPEQLVDELLKVLTAHAKNVR